jgi:hypothetical protein
MYEELREVLMPFNAKELENFNEATQNCTADQKIAVAKRMGEERLPSGFQFTESQIRRFVKQDSLSKVNWYPNIKIGGEGDSAADVDGATVMKERQYNAYRTSGMSEAEASAMSGFTPVKA